MTPKQERFVQEYMVDMNATQAAIRAGYSPKWANKNVTQLTANKGIASAIKSARAKSLQTSELTRERIILEIKRLAMSDPRKLYDPATGRLKHVLELDDDMAAAVYSPETKVVNLKAGDGVQDSIAAIKTWDKGKALEQLVRIFGMNAAEKSEITIVGSKLSAARARLAGRPSPSAEGKGF